MLVVLALLMAFAAGCGEKDEPDPVTPEPVTPEPPAATSLQEALDDVVAAGVPGVALAIRTPDGTRFLSAGRASLEPPRPIAPADHYRIASVTKSFTAAIVMQLISEGKLALASRLSAVVPGLLPGKAITVGQLLGHTSGLPDYVKDPRFAEIVGNGGKLTPELVVGLVADKPLEFPPGSRYGYSDTDNIVAGLVIERVTGSSFESELERRILKPAGLAQTSLAHRFAFPKPHAQGYQFDPEAEGAEPEDVTDVPIDADGAWASGALISTPQDVAKFFAALLSGEIVKARPLAAMMQTRPGAGSPPGPGRTTPASASSAGRFPAARSGATPGRCRASARSVPRQPTGQRRPGWWSTRPRFPSRPKRRFCARRSSSPAGFSASRRAKRRRRARRRRRGPAGLPPGTARRPSRGNHRARARSCARRCVR